MAYSMDLRLELLEALDMGESVRTEAAAGCAEN